MVNVTFSSDTLCKSLTFRLLKTHRERLVGLLHERHKDACVVFMRCRSIHTFGMRNPIDVAFLSQYGEVLASFREVPSGKIRSCPKAYCALERFSNAGSWLEIGEIYFVSDISTMTADTRQSSRRKGHLYDVQCESLSKMRRKTLPGYGGLLRMSLRFPRKRIANKQKY